MFGLKPAREANACPNLNLSAGELADRIEAKWESCATAGSLVRIVKHVRHTSKPTDRHGLSSMMSPGQLFAVCQRYDNISRLNQMEYAIVYVCPAPRGHFRKQVSTFNRRVSSKGKRRGEAEGVFNQR